MSGDTNGTPDFLGGTATVANGMLTGLTFRVEANTFIDGFRSLTASDLFIDSDADREWDYVVKSWGQRNGTYELYEVSEPLGDFDPADPENTDYIQADQDNYRKYHPVGLDIVGDAVGTGRLSGWWNETDPQIGDIYTVSWELSPIALGPEFTIGFSVMCANDVVYETLPLSVPEPASIFLLGTGVLGLAVLRRLR